MIKICPAPYHLLILGILGVSSIWGFIGYWGRMFDNFDTIVATGTLPDGRPMRMSYTGVEALDRQITPVIAFYEVLTNGFSTGPRMLFLDINFVVVCANVWVMIESRRRGGHPMLKYPFILIFLWNFIGAALIQPHYLYLIVQSQSNHPQDPTLPRHEAIALFLTTIGTILSPSLLLFAPAWLQASTWTHHGLIALFHTTPILLAIIFYTTAWILGSVGRFLTGSSDQNNQDQPWIIRSYILAGVTSATVHLFTILTALGTRNPDATLLRLFVPTWERLVVANTLPLSWIAGSNTTDGKAAEVLEQFHLFSQFDWIVVSLACIIFTHLLLSRARDKHKSRDRNLLDRMSDVEKRDWVLLLLGMLVLGPGAAGSFGLAVRETRLRQQWNRSNKLQ